MCGRHAAEPLWWVVLVCGMASYIDAAAITGFSSTLAILHAAGRLEQGTVGIAAGALTLGIAIGALSGGRLGDRYGRRPVFVTTMAVIVLASLTLAVTPTATVMIAVPVMMGLAIGADLPVSLATIAESAPRQSRGAAVVFTNVLWVAGIGANLILVTIVGFRGPDAVVLIFGHIAVVSLLVLLARLTISESRIWRLARQEKVAGVRTIRAQRSQFRDLLRGPYLPPFAGLLIFYSLTNLAANTNGQFGPYVLVNFAGLSISEASGVLFISLPLVLAGLLWYALIARRGVVMPLFLVGAFCAVAASLVLALFGVSPQTYSVALILGAVGNVLAFEAVMKIWAQQSFPTLIRATAQGGIIAVARLVAATFAVITPLLLDAGTTVLYGILACASAVGMVTAWLTFRKRGKHDEFEVESDTESAS